MASCDRVAPVNKMSRQGGDTYGHPEVCSHAWPRKASDPWLTPMLVEPEIKPLILIVRDKPRLSATEDDLRWKAGQR